MSREIKPWNSLRTRVTLATLVISLACIWLLTLFVGRNLQIDMERLVSDQQFSAATLVASEINQEMAFRLSSLESVAALISPQWPTGFAALQRVLESQLTLSSLFNAGIAVLDDQGTVIAAVTKINAQSVSPVGMNYLERKAVKSALQSGRSTIGDPTLGKYAKAPVIAIAVPIRSATGVVVGALYGGIHLGMPNFLDHLLDHRYGKTGGYLLIDPSNRMVVTATDKSLVMQKMRPAGTAPLIDRFVQGYEGSGLVVNNRGVELLSSARKVPVADWYLSASMPTQEAFAPIQSLKQRLFAGALFLSLVASLLAWWLLGRELVPLLQATRLLTEPLSEGATVQHVPVGKADEIGLLIESFNQLLVRLEARERLLLQSEQRLRLALQGGNLGLWDWNPQNESLVVNSRWLTQLGLDAAIPPDIDLWRGLIHPADRDILRREVSRVVHDPNGLDFEVEVRVLHSDGHYVCLLDKGAVVERDASGKATRVVGTHYDITARKLANEKLQLALADKEALLREVHHRVKNNLQVISSLLRLESSRSESEGTRQVLGKMQNRIRSMALLHELLYRSDTFAEVNLGDYLTQLATQAYRSAATDQSTIRLTLDLQSVQVPMDKATSCGLLVNELLSNCLKHAFVDGQSGEVRIQLEVANGESLWRLSVSDNGVGLPADWDTHQATTLGHQLVSDLVTQLNGKLEIGPGPGTTFTMTFNPAES